MCTTSVVVALYRTTGAAAAAGTVVGFILKGRLDAAGTPMLRETGSATGDGTENSDQAQTLPSLHARSPPLVLSACPPLPLLPAARASAEEEGEALVLRSPGSPRSTSSPPPLPPSPTPRPQPPPRASVTALPTTLLFSPLFSSPRLASPHRLIHSPRRSLPRTRRASLIFQHFVAGPRWMLGEFHAFR